MKLKIEENDLTGITEKRHLIVVVKKGKREFEVECEYTMYDAENMAIANYNLDILDGENKFDECEREEFENAVIEMMRRGKGESEI